MKRRVLVGLGSNIGEKQQNIKNAGKKIAALEGVETVKESSLYVTPPWGKTDQQDFINQVMELETDLSPWKLLQKLQEIEINMGRQRLERWGPRIIDLDILLYGDEIIESEELTIPHPYMYQRLFVLIPLEEINSELIFPDGSKIKEVLNRAEVRDRDNYIRRIN